VGRVRPDDGRERRRRRPGARAPARPARTAPRPARASGGSRLAWRVQPAWPAPTGRRRPRPVRRSPRRLPSTWSAPPPPGPTCSP
jgi:hypothetical protein